MSISREESQSDAPSDSPAGETEEFRLLNEYVDQLQRYPKAKRPSILQANPDLDSAIDCLEALELLAGDIDHSRTEQDLGLTRGLDQVSPGHSPRISVVAKGVTQIDTPILGSFGDYELLGEIGRGGMGIVYRARQKSLDRYVAVKMILGGHLAPPDQVQRFQGEARAAAAVCHPNIVSIFDAGQAEGQQFFVMELVEGASLAEHLRRGGFDRDTAVRWVIQIARAVDHLHRQGIMHRDLKPSNILIDREGRPLVNDFGLAKVFALDVGLTNTGLIAGTPSYMAPEQARGRNDSIGPACDVYSLGAMLFELLTGRPPFRAETPLDTILQVLEREPAPPRTLNPAIPAELEWITLRCLQKSPSKRYPSAAALAEDLERHLRGEAISTPPPGRLERTWRWIKREPALASHLAVMGCFYLIQLANYHIFHVIDWSFHFPVSLIMLIWVATLLVCQQLSQRERWADVARFGWASVDMGAILALLLWADGAASPLIVALPLVVVGSGLWFRVRLVWFTTVLALIAYLVLALDFYARRSDLRSHFDAAYDRHIFFMIMLLALGCVVAYQVRRIRKLSRYYERHCAG